MYAKQEWGQARPAPALRLAAVPSRQDTEDISPAMCCGGVQRGDSEGLVEELRGVCSLLGSLSKKAGNSLAFNSLVFFFQ